MSDNTKIMWLIETRDYDQAYTYLEKVDEEGNLDLAYLASNFFGYVEILKKKLPHPKE